MEVYGSQELDSACLKHAPLRMRFLLLTSHPILATYYYVGAEWTDGYQTRTSQKIFRTGLRSEASAAFSRASAVTDVLPLHGPHAWLSMSSQYGLVFSDVDPVEVFVRHVSVPTGPILPGSRIGHVPSTSTVVKNGSVATVDLHAVAIPIAVPTVLAIVGSFVPLSKPLPRPSIPSPKVRIGG
eukprot:scaffold1220_cov259-Pinguiococcus_pyrenoidosus.AAC.144